MLKQSTLTIRSLRRRERSSLCSGYVFSLCGWGVMAWPPFSTCCATNRWDLCLKARKAELTLLSLPSNRFSNMHLDACLPADAAAERQSIQAHYSLLLTGNWIFGAGHLQAPAQKPSPTNFSLGLATVKTHRRYHRIQKAESASRTEHCWPKVARSRWLAKLRCHV